MIRVYEYPYARLYTLASKRAGAQQTKEAPAQCLNDTHRDKRLEKRCVLHGRDGVNLIKPVGQDE